MTNPAHLLSVAALLLVAFLFGAVIGSLARLLVRRLPRQAVAPAAPVIAASPAPTPLVAAPVIAPLPVPSAPSPPPADIPVPDFTATLLALADEAPPPAFAAALNPQPEPAAEAVGAVAGMLPARAAGQATSGRLVPPPLPDDWQQGSTTATEQHTAEVIPVPSTAPELPEAPVSELPAEAPAKASELDTIDEDAAMRAIEGNWTPKRAPVRPATVADASEAVAASARAIAAARRTVEATLAEVAMETGRPTGLDAPRDGGKDDLTHIIGVLPVIETALNQLGIYHFDQLGALTDENIGWIENHLGVPGRISRELWREQARELAAVLKPKRAVES